MAASVAPVALSERMRAATDAGVDCGRPRRMPSALLTASASLVRFPDQPALELGEGRHHVRHDLADRRRGVHVHVEGDQPPALLLSPVHEAGEVEASSG